LVIGVLLGIPQFLKAQISAPKYSNEFLTLGVGARGIGMAGAQVAVSNDVTSGYWNPAGLTGVVQYEGSLMHSDYFRGLANYNYGAAAFRLDSAGVLGVSFIRYAVDNIADTRYLIQNGQIDYWASFLSLRLPRKSSILQVKEGATFRFQYSGKDLNSFRYRQKSTNKVSSNLFTRLNLESRFTC
jgi:hypothetical protein